MIAKVVTMANKNFSFLRNERLQLKMKADGKKREKTFSQFGIWFDGEFYWLHGEEWRTRTYMHSNSGVVYTKLKHKTKPISLNIEEAIHPFQPMFLRKIMVSNQSAINKVVKLYFFQNVYDEQQSADTAFFAPKDKVMLHYQQERCWLFNGEFTSEGKMHYTTFSQLNKTEIETHSLNKSNGNLFMNPIAKGNVTSILSVSTELPPYESKCGYYWFTLGQTKEELMEINEEIKSIGPKEVMKYLIVEQENDIKKLLQDEYTNPIPLYR